MKLILTKVSFNRALFEKELRKALKMLQPADLPAFRIWCYEQFARVYRNVLKAAFGHFQEEFPIAGVG